MLLFDKPNPEVQPLVRWSRPYEEASVKTFSLYKFGMATRGGDFVTGSGKVRSNVKRDRQASAARVNR
jgi:hypothetical protein